MPCCLSFFFSIATMPRTRRRFRPARARLRLHTFLQTKCFICLDSPGEYPSWKLPCCRRFIHEACLLRCFRFAEGVARDKCPHCRQRLSSYHHTAAVIPLGPYPFCFYRVSFPPPPPPPPDPFWWVELQGLLLDGYGPDEDDLFPDYILPPPPAGWQAFRLGHR